jgi:hypothetical protein
MTWHIIERNVLKDRRYWVRVRCDCGYIGLRREAHVISGRTKSCKACSAVNTLKEYPNPYFSKRSHKGLGDLTRTRWFLIKNGAKRRSIAFDLTIEYVASLFTGRCSLSGVPISLTGRQDASLDRKDSTLSYLEGNVQWVHKILNRMKGKLSDEEFVKWCRLVVSYYDEVAECDLTKGGSCGS